MPEVRRAVVVGCGAMGSTFAAALHRGGSAVTAIERDRDIVDAINDHGLRVTNAAGELETHHIDVRLDADGLVAPDLVFVFVKAGDNPGVRAMLASVVGESTAVVTVQNGIGHGEALSEVIAPDRLVVGVTNEGANTVSPGHIAHYSLGESTLGPFVPGQDSATTERAAEALRAGGFTVHAVDDPRPAMWTKLAFNSAYSAVAALTRLSLFGMGEERSVWQLGDAVVRESAAIAALAGVEVDADGVVARAESLYRAARANPQADGRASMLLDVEAHRRTEVEALNGAIVAEAERLGVDAPLNRALAALVRGLESSW